MASAAPRGRRWAGPCAAPGRASCAPRRRPRPLPIRPARDPGARIRQPPTAVSWAPGTPTWVAVSGRSRPAAALAGPPALRRPAAAWRRPGGPQDALPAARPLGPVKPAATCLGSSPSRTSIVAALPPPRSTVVTSSRSLRTRCLGRLGPTRRRGSCPRMAWEANLIVAEQTGTTVNIYGSIRIN